MTHSINSGCKVPETVLRQAVRHASNDRPDLALQSLETYGLSEDQKSKISGVFQLCKQDPLEAPEWQRRIVAVINNEGIAESNEVGPGKSCLNEDNSLTISNACIDPGCDVSILHEDIFTQIFTCVTDSQSFVLLAKTCKLANQVFQSKIVQICFFKEKVKELSLQSFNAYWEYLNELPEDFINFQKTVKVQPSPTHLHGALQHSFSKEAEVQEEMIEGQKTSFNLDLLSNPFPAIGKCLIIFSREAAKLDEFHSDAFFIYAQDKLKLYKEKIFFITEDDLYSPILRTICNSVCHEILYSFASQPLGEISPETVEKMISHVKELLISCHSDMEEKLMLKGDRVLRGLITTMILNLHSKEECQQFEIELNKIGIDRANIIIRNCYDADVFLVDLFARNNLDTITPDTFDEAALHVADILGQNGINNIDLGDIKRITKKVILEYHTPEEIQRYADQLMWTHENVGDVFGGDHYKALAEFYRGLLN